MSNLKRASGLIPDSNGNKQALEIMIENARLFYQAGGIITFRDWMEFDDSEKIAFIIARESFQKDADEVDFLERIVDRTAEKLNQARI